MGNVCNDVWPGREVPFLPREFLSPENKSSWGLSTLKEQ